MLLKNKNTKLSFRSSKKTLLIFIVAFAVTGGAYLAYRSFAYTNTTIVATWSSYVNNKMRLYTLNAGGQTKEITSLPVGLSPSSPDLSSDGKSIVFSGNGDIHTVTASGTNYRELFRDTGAEFPAYSPKATKIAFTRWSNDGGGIYVMNADGSSRRRLLRVDGLSGAKLKWSRDGKYITTYISPNYTDNIRPGIYVINAQTGSFRRVVAVTNDRYYYYLHDASSSRVLYTQYDRKSYIKRINVIKFDGSGFTTLSRNTTNGEGAATFSPAGTTVFFIGDNGSIRKVSLSSKKESQAIPDWNPSHADYARSVSYTGDNTGLIVMNAAYASPTWYDQFVLSTPDGKTVKKIFWQSNANYRVYNPGF